MPAHFDPESFIDWLKTQSDVTLLLTQGRQAPGAAGNLMLVAGMTLELAYYQRGMERGYYELITVP